MHKLSFKKAIIAAIIVLAIAQVITLGLLSKINNDLNKKTEDTNQSIQLAYNEIDSDSVQQTLAPIPGAQRLYMAEFNLTVELNETTRTMRYYEDTEGNVRITSAYMFDHQMREQSCDDMVRLRIEPKPNAYSPSQPHYATVMLSDGRPLQIYASTLKECATAWRALTPQQLAEQFKGAQTY